MNMLVTPANGSAILTPTPQSALVFGPRATSTLANPVMDVQRRTNIITGPEDPNADIVGGRSLDYLSSCKANSSIETLLKTYRLFTDFIWAHVNPIGQ